jgi:hypothetical protein
MNFFCHSFLISIFCEKLSKLSKGVYIYGFSKFELEKKCNFYVKSAKIHQFCHQKIEIIKFFFKVLEKKLFCFCIKITKIQVTAIKYKLHKNDERLTSLFILNPRISAKPCQFRFLQAFASWHPSSF